MSIEGFPPVARAYAQAQLNKQIDKVHYPDQWLVGVAKKYCIDKGLSYPGSIDHPIRVVEVYKEDKVWFNHDPTNRNRSLVHEYHRAEALKDSPRYTHGTWLDEWWLNRLKASGEPTSLDQAFVLQIKIDEVIKHRQSQDPVCENSVWTTKGYKDCAFWPLSQDTDYLARIKTQWRALKEQKIVQGET